MKRVISLVLVLVLCLSVTALFSGCSSEHPIEAFWEKMDAADNYQIVFTMSDIPLLGTLTITNQVDGNITYTPAVLFSSAEYVETVGDVKYTYTENDDGTWTKTEGTEDEDDSSLTDDDIMEEILDPENFDAVKGEENKFRQKEDVSFENFDDVVITIEDDKCTIEMTVTSEGITCSAEIEISKIGEIELTLPKVE